MTVGGRHGVWFATVLSAFVLAACAVTSPTPPEATSGPTVIVTSAAAPTVTVTPQPPDTIMINVNALDGQSQVDASYRVDDDVADQFDPAACSEPSEHAVSAGTYACGASAYQADACWKRGDGDLVCIDRPWDRVLSVRHFDGTLPDTGLPERSTPLGLQLEDGSRYRSRNGTGGAGTPPEDLTVAYYCAAGPCEDDPDAPAAVLVGEDPLILKSGNIWFVLVGTLSGDNTNTQTLPPPAMQRVVRAWFITTD